jgi:tRNA threonylcarbamoyladenosine biosynthesis protein TsaB
MLILAIETATSVESVALVTEERVLAEVNAATDSGHSVKLLNNIDKLFNKTKLDISRIDAVAVSAGPGSFTGLRVGFSLAKGLAYAAKKPLFAVPTLDALVYSYAKTEKRIIEKTGKIKKGLKLFCPLLDARKEEYYFSAYSSGEKELIRLLPYASLPAWAIIKAVKNMEAESVIFFGDGVIKMGEEIKKTFKKDALAEIYPRAFAVGALALLQLKNGENQDFEKTLPMYIRKPDAVLNKEAKEAGAMKK